MDFIIVPSQSAILERMGAYTEPEHFMCEQFALRAGNRRVTPQQLVDSLWEAYIELSSFMLTRQHLEHPEWQSIAQRIIATFVPDNGIRRLLFRLARDKNRY